MASQSSISSAVLAAPERIAIRLNSSMRSGIASSRYCKKWCPIISLPILEELDLRPPRTLAQLLPLWASAQRATKRPSFDCLSRLPPDSDISETVSSLRRRRMGTMIERSRKVSGKFPIAIATFGRNTGNSFGSMIPTNAAENVCVSSVACVQERKAKIVRDLIFDCAVFLLHHMIVESKHFDDSEHRCLSNVHGAFRTSTDKGDEFSQQGLAATLRWG